MTDLGQQELDLEKEIHNKIMELATIKAKVMDYSYPEAVADACAVIYDIDSTMCSWPKKDYDAFQDRLSGHLESILLIK